MDIIIIIPILSVFASVVSEAIFCIVNIIFIAF